MQNKILLILIISVLSFSCIHFLNRTDQPAMPLRITPQEEFPEAIGFVNDFEDIIDRVVEIEMERLIITHKNKTTNQIAIVTLENIENYTDFDQYTLDLANHWGVGEKDKNNGILIAISKKLRKIRIQVGDGLLDKLTNEETKSIIDELGVPNFKSEEYSKGIDLCLREIIKELL